MLLGIGVFVLLVLVLFHFFFVVEVLPILVPVLSTVHIQPAVGVAVLV